MVAHNGAGSTSGRTPGGASGLVRTDDRRIARVSRQELERRWSLVRAHLQEQRWDALIVVGGDDELGGYSWWLADAPASYRRVVVFHVDDDMTVIEHGAMYEGRGCHRQLAGAHVNYPGVGELITVAQFRSVAYTQEYELRELVEVLQRRGCRDVALAGAASMPYAFCRGLLAGLGRVRFHDATDFLDRCKAFKSPEELECLRQGARIQDAVFADMLAQVRAGLHEYELAAVGVAAARRRGGDHGIVMCGSAAPGDPALLRGSSEQRRVIQAGDCLSVLVENGSPWNLYCELGRNVCLGPVPAALQDAFDQALAAQAYTLSLCRPGASCADIARAHDAYMIEHGLAPETRLYAHGQGYDLVERPLLRADETLRLEAGMCITVHPATVSDSVFAFVCDNVVIGTDGPEPIHATPRRVFSV